MGAILLGPDHALTQVLRVTLRQDPDLIFAENARTDEELRLLRNAMLTGHGTIIGMEVDSPEVALKRLTEVLPELPPRPLFVHHTRDPRSGAPSISLHVVEVGTSEQPRIVPWDTLPVH